MQKRDIQEHILRKLMARRKWGGSHTEETNLTKGLPSNLIGQKIVEAAIDELYQKDFLHKSKKNKRMACFFKSSKEKGDIQILRHPP